MVGCVPDIIPINVGNPDGKYETTKTVKEAEEIVKTAKRNTRRFNKKNDSKK